MRACFGILKGLMSATAALALAACGGGTGGTGAPAPGGPATGASFGVVTNVTPAPAAGAAGTSAQITVNGVTFSVSSSTPVSLDDNPARNVNDLREGMVVTVTGSITGASGTASQIVVDDSVKGRVEVGNSVDPRQIQVMGQKVFFDDRTKYEDRSTSGPVSNGPITWAAGDDITVHGHVMDRGVIVASFVTKNAQPAATVEVRGVVAALSNSSFTIGSLTVNFGNAVFKDMSPGSLVDGVLVEVKGTCAGALPCVTLNASVIEPTGMQVANVSDAAEVEGYVTSLNGGASSDFMIGTQRVTTAADTIFAGGASTDILQGVEIEAEGTLTNGILAAKKISFRGNVVVEGDVATTSTSALIQLAQLPGINVTWDSLTVCKGVASAICSEIGTGHIRARGRVIATTTTSVTIIATRLEQTDTAVNGRAKVALQGLATTKAGDTKMLTILGVDVDTTAVPDPAATGNGFFDLLGAPMTRVDFFNAVNAAIPNSLVQVEGKYDTVKGGVVWEKAEIED